MRTFYIFKINKEYSKLSYDIPYNLFSAFLNIKLGTLSNINYLYNEYFSFIDPFNKSYLSKSIYNRLSNVDGYSVFGNTHTFNNYYTDESSKLIIYNSYMTIKTNKFISSFFKELSYLPNLFVIDFDNNDYFWLSRINN